MIFLKGSSDLSHFIFEINVVKSRIRHKTTLNDAIFNRFGVDLEIQFQSRSMSDPTLSDIHFNYKMAWVWTTLNIVSFYLNRISYHTSTTQVPHKYRSNWALSHDYASSLILFNQVFFLGKSLGLLIVLLISNKRSKYSSQYFYFNPEIRALTIVRS